MKNNIKSIFLVTTLILLLVGLSAISAAEVSDDTTLTSDTDDSTVIAPEATTQASDNNIADTPTKNIKKESTDTYVKDSSESDDNSKDSNAISLNKDDEKNTKAAVNEHSFSELQTIINNAAEGSVIDLQYDYSLTGNDTTLRINKALTINGNNHTLNGMEKKRIIFANFQGAPSTGEFGLSLTLKDINLINGGGQDNNMENEGMGGINPDLEDPISGTDTYNNMGGAIYCNTTIPNPIEDLVIINCTFENNRATEAGGAIYANGKVTIYDSHFFYNEVEQGNGGALYAGLGSTIFNSTFENNCVKHGLSGGIEIIANVASIYDIGNYYKLSGQVDHVPSTGGAIFSKGLTKINDSVFKNNYVGEKNELGCDGGAVHSIGAINMSNCNFTGNKAYDQHGGAVLCNVHTHIYNCNFKDNIANVGGAVSSFQKFDAHNSTFKNNGNEIGTTWIEEQSLDGALSILGFIPVVGDLISASLDLMDALGIELGVGSTNSNSTGGAIYARGETCTIEDCVFDKNHASEYGGAIYAENKTTVKNSNFTSNKVSRSETPLLAINFNERDGGAIHAETSLDIRNCNFISNQAAYEGGTVYCGQDCTIRDSTFSYSTASTNGGAVYTKTMGKVSNTKFIDNTITKDSGDGGAIYIAEACNPEFINCEFSGNKAGSDGGAICLDSSGSSLKISNSTFTQNTVQVDGGAIYCEGLTIIANSTFKSNNANGEGTARSFGGAIRSLGNMTVDNSNFEHNSAYNLGGAIYADEEITLTNSNFTSNSAKEGGGVYADIINNEVKNSIFIENKAFSGDGGAVYINAQSWPKFNYCIFNNNLAYTNSTVEFAQGGAIYVDKGNAQLKVTNSNFTSNIAEDGGAIYATIITEVSNSVFTKNRAHTNQNKGDGGAIYINENYDDNYYNIYYCIFEENSCDRYGGAIYTDSVKSHLRVYNSTFISNTAKEGGAVYAHYLTKYLSSCNFINNKATGGSGGAVYVGNDDPGNLTVAYCELMYSTYTNNSCTEEGGAIYFASDYSSTKITNCSFTDNSANEGGAVYAGHISYVTNSSFIKNTASDGSGGGVYVVNNLDTVSYSHLLTAELINSLFDQNNAKGNGGGFYMGDHDSTIKVISCSFSHNYAGNGGGLYAHGKVTDINNSVFLYNSCYSDGGAVYVNRASPNLYTISSRYEYNNARNRGGAIYIDSSATMFTINYCTFVNNTAEKKDYNAHFRNAAGHDIFNKGTYYYNRLNWWGTNNPEPYTERIVNDTGSPADIDCQPTDYFKIVLEIDIDYYVNLIAGNPYTARIRLAGTDYTPQNYPVYHSAGEFWGDGTFTDIQANVNDVTATVVLNPTVGSENITIYGRLDNQIVSLSIHPKDKDPCTVKILSCEDVKYPNPLKVTYTITPEMSNPTYEIKDNEGITVKTGIITSADTLYVEGLKHGNYSITINNSETWTVLPGSDTANFQVYRDDIESLSIVVNNKTYPEEVEGIVYSSRDGVYNITIGEQSTTATVDGGSGTFNMGVLPADDYQITVSFDGDDYFNPLSNDTTFTVYPSNTVLELEVNPSEITYGESATVTPILPSTATGTVKYYLNGTLVDELDVTEEFTLPVLDAGTYEIKGNYSGDNNHKKANKTITITVKQAPNNVVVNVSNVTYNNNTLINLTADVDGDYKLNINGTTYNITVKNGIENKTVKLDAGKYYANVTFNNKNYDTKSNNTTFEVYKADTNINIIANTTTYPQEVKGTINSNVNGKYNLTVANKTTTVTVTNGVGEFNLGVMDAGTYTITAKYAGDKNYKPATKNITVTVKQATNNANVSVANVTYGKNATIIVSAKIDGTYQVDINKTIKNVKVKNGKGNITLALNAGNYYANVTFNNKNYNTTTKNTTFKVNKANTNIKILTNDTIYPQQVKGSINASVDGKYNLNIGNYSTTITVKNSIGQFNAGVLNSGEYMINVSYPGDANHNPATATLPVKVDKRNILMDIEANNINIGQTQKIIIKVPANTTGNITLTLENKNYTAKIKDGQATINIPNLTVGDKNAKAYYSGDTNHNPSTSTVSFKVKDIDTEKINTQLTLKVSNNTPTVNNTITITATLTDKTGNKLANQNITINIENKNYTIKTNTNGQSTQTHKLTKIGTTTITAQYNGNNDYNPSTSTLSINVNDINPEKINTQLTLKVSNTTPKVSDTITITATLTDKDNKKLAGQNITITVEDKTYTVKTNTNGQATQTHKLTKAQTTTITAQYNGNNNYNPSSTTSKITVKENILNSSMTITANNTKPRVRENVLITITLKDEKNNPLKNQEIKATINGENRTVKTNNNGIATTNYTVVKKDKNVNITATYTGNATQKSTTGNLTIDRYYKADMELLTGSFDSKPGQTVKLIAHLTDNQVDIDGGQLVFKLNGVSLKDEKENAVVVNIKNGLAVLEYKIPDTLSARTHNLTAVYSSKDYGRVDLSTPMTIGKYTTHIDINPLYTTNDKITIKAQIVDQNNQALNKQTTISIKVNGKSYSLNTTNGTIDYTITQTLKDGYYNISIISGENGKYLGATVKTLLIKSNSTIKTNYINNTLNKDTTSKSGDTKTSDIMSILTGSSMVKPGDRLKLIAHLSEDQVDITGGQLVFKLNGVSLKDEQGNAVVVNINQGLGVLDYKIPDTLGARTHNLTAVYSSKQYGKVELSTDLTMNRLNTHIEAEPIYTTGTTSYIKAKILDDNNQLINKETSVVIKVDGKSYAFNTTTGSINYKVPTTLTAGLHQITIIAGENGKYISSRANTVLIKT